MPRGGARAGAGRKPGSGWRPAALRSVAREQLIKTIEDGRDPLTVLVDFAFDESMDPGVRLQAAIAASPYFHPRLSVQAIESTSTNVTVDAAAVMNRLVDRLGRLAPPEPADTIDVIPEPAKDPVGTA